ncbi:MAG: hypothetical protein JNL28_03530 [Planctomycetes bacterium]|nr:hypothetical protein [Planctomycetota bacterium]
MSAGPDPHGEKPKPSFGNMGPEHWSRARRDSNAEALEYYRERSRAPGVREGGAERNHYCMQCDGVIPFDAEAEVCPHCGAALEGEVKRYFNWVEINEPPRSDTGTKVFMLGAAVLVCVSLAALVWWLSR